MTWFEGFDDRRLPVGDIALRVRTGGRPDAPPLLLLHGFPQTGAMWHRVAQRLAPHHSLVIPDLRGYGESDKPAGAIDHANYSKRTMAADLHTLMRRLGHERYRVAGHDRGARVAHRLALDQPQAVQCLALLDIVPTKDMYDATDMRFASAYYHWFFLIQPAPNPERMIGHDPEHYLRWKLGGWGSLGHKFYEPEAVAEYLRCFSRPEAIHGACEDYRASATVDVALDAESVQAGVQIACDLLVLWGTRGVIHALFDPLALWRARCAGTVTGEAMEAGHYLAEELPDETAQRLLGFFGG
ncbi:alpha/beta fold hydrolase [Ideonella sp. A 288]|uniref:alpha/beta fold hydrolase n=1 Tax=Ideonella sp. A 288 TaxID=1962181 RepID=UPI000B4BFD49|nr:alpha/beta hydrolase [Ideonella sp. A 288]